MVAIIFRLSSAHRLCAGHLSLYRHYSAPPPPAPSDPSETPEERGTDSDHPEPPPVSRQAVTHDVIRACGRVRNAAKKQIGTRANRVRVKYSVFRGEVRRNAVHAWMFAFSFFFLFFFFFFFFSASRLYSHGFAHPQFSETVFAHLTSSRNLGLQHMAKTARLPFSGWAL